MKHILLLSLLHKRPIFVKYSRPTRPNAGLKFYRVKKNWVGNFIGLKKNWVRNCIGLKKMGRKFGLVKFYFSRIRFVCDLLLITAKLNNNNTEFLWWWWWVVGGGLQSP